VRPEEALEAAGLPCHASARERHAAPAPRPRALASRTDLSAGQLRADDGKLASVKREAVRPCAWARRRRAPAKPVLPAARGPYAASPAQRHGARLLHSDRRRCAAPNTIRPLRLCNGEPDVRNELNELLRICSRDRASIKHGEVV
jgi:hypothetical protein